MINLTDIIIFIQRVKDKEIEIYNEFSLQHELGFFLREKFENIKIQFERNVEFFFSNNSKIKDQFIKREIDISGFKQDSSSNIYPQFAIELKFPRKGQYPEQMYSFCKDIAFIEQLVKRGFKKAVFIAFVDDHLFYEGKKTDGIYKYFRNGNPIHGKINKPTGKKVRNINIQGRHTVQWKKLTIIYITRL